MGRTLPRRVISPVMARSRRTGILLSALEIAVAIVMPAEGPSFGMAPSGTCTCRSRVAIEIAGQAEAVRARANVRHGGLRRFLHHVAEFAGERQLALAIDDGGFRAENRAANFGPSQAGDQSHFALFMRQRVAELDDAQEVVDVLAGDGDGIVLAFLHDLAGDFAADVADFALQIAHASFAGVGADEPGDGFIGELDVLFRQAGVRASAS